MTKELWIESYEILVEQFMEDGLPEKEAEERAADEAHDHMIDKWTSMADNLRKAAKEQL